MGVSHAVHTRDYVGVHYMLFVIQVSSPKKNLLKKKKFFKKQKFRQIKRKLRKPKKDQSKKKVS